MRIIAGKHKGLNLYSFDEGNIRPTTDRVKENIFNKLQFEIVEADVLDLFAGTGAISLEFISRGAGNVFTCDNNARSITLIKKNFSKSNEKLNLYEGDYKNALNELKEHKFDIIFLDPPYVEDFGECAIEIIAKLGLLKLNGIIVYEHLIDKDFNIPDSLKLIETKKYGTIGVSYIRWADNV